MTIVPIIKRCPKCHKNYSWNPDVGKMFCPYCGGLGTKPNKLFTKKTKDKKEENL